MHNVETTQVPLLVDNDTRSSHITTTSDHDDVSRLKFDVVDNLVLHKVEFDSVVDLDGWVGVTDGSAIVGDNVRNTLGTKLMSTDLAEFERSLLGTNSVNGESTLDIVKETEVLARSLNRHDV